MSSKGKSKLVRANSSSASNVKGSSTPWTSGASMGKCYDGHPALPLGDGLVIYGGSCGTPKVKDADIYIGFDRSMNFTERVLPWNEGVEVPYYVTDHSVPQHPENYRKLVEWTAEQIKAGKKVHAGCIGGHGRTGMFFAALVQHMCAPEDAVAYVREHYCAKVVESQSQCDFLTQHFGCQKSKPRAYSGSGSSVYSEGRNASGHYGGSFAGIAQSHRGDSSSRWEEGHSYPPDVQWGSSSGTGKELTVRHPSTPHPALIWGLD